MSRAALGPILDHVRAEPSRTWSIIITVFGDAIQPRGGSVWLGTLLSFFEALDIPAGVVRTSMSRLVGDGWLTRHRLGRRSFYHLAARGQETFEQAAAQIYRAGPLPFAGWFETVLVESAASDVLRLAGFAGIAPGVWIAPGGAVVPAGEVHWRSVADDAASRALAARAWPLERIAASYQRFIQAFAPLRQACALSPVEAMVGRILLIHAYRRIVLADPVLPLELLPPDWPGTAARALCQAVYPMLLEASEAWLDGNALNEQGALPQASSLATRFQ